MNKDFSFLLNTDFSSFCTLNATSDQSKEQLYIDSYYAQFDVLGKPIEVLEKPSVVQNIQLSSEAQAKLSCRHIKEDTRLLLNVTHSQIEQIRECQTIGKSVSIVKDEIIGRSCSDAVETEGRFTPEETINLLQHVLSVLTHMHDRGLTHGNLSPETIYLRSEDCTPILTQFEFFQEVLEHSDEPSDPNLRTKVFQLTGSPVPRGISGDLYCLMLTAVMLLTGRPLEVLFDQQTQSWDWMRYQPLKNNFSQLINRMLSFDTDNRYRSAEEILLAIHLLDRNPLSYSSTARVRAYA